MARRTQRVHFSGDCEEGGGHGEGGEVLVARLAGGVLEVHLGLLKVAHHYRVSVALSEGQLLEAAATPPSASAPAPTHLFPNLRARIVRLWPTNDGLHLIADIFAEMDKVFDETIYFHVPGREEPLKLRLEASVFGKYDGCPRLSGGVRCTGYEKEYESDTSMENK